MAIGLRAHLAMVLYQHIGKRCKLKKSRNFERQAWENEQWARFAASPFLNMPTQKKKQFPHNQMLEK